MGDIYRAVGVQAGRGSLGVLYRTENLLEPTVLMWVTAALCVTTIRSMSFHLIRTRQVHFRTTLILIMVVGLHECGNTICVFPVEFSPLD